MQTHLNKQSQETLSNDITVIDSVMDGQVRLLVSGTSITVVVQQAMNSGATVWQTISTITTAGLHSFNPLPNRKLRYDVTYTDGRISAAQLSSF